MMAIPQCQPRERECARGERGDLQRLHLGLSLLEPEPHAHLVEQVHRRREMFRRLLIASSPVQLAEADVAMSDERAHAKLQSQGIERAVAGFGRWSSRDLTPSRRGGGGPKPHDRVALAGEHYSTCAEVARLLHPACEQECLAGVVLIERRYPIPEDA